MTGFDHIVLFFTEKSMLGRKQAGQPGTESLLEEDSCMHKITVSGCLIGKKSQTFAVQS
jgi:hypothetical protein